MQDQFLSSIKSFGKLFRKIYQKKNKKVFKQNPNNKIVWMKANKKNKIDLYKLFYFFNNGIKKIKTTSLTLYP